MSVPKSGETLLIGLVKWIARLIITKILVTNKEGVPSAILNAMNVPL